MIERLHGALVLPLASDVYGSKGGNTLIFHAFKSEAEPQPVGTGLSIARTTDGWRRGQGGVYWDNIQAGNFRHHYSPGGIYLGALIEGARTNELLWNRDLSNAVWTKTNITAVKNATGVDNISNAASILTASAGNGTVFQAVTLASAIRTCSFWVRRKTGAGTINFSDDGGATYTDITASLITSTFTKFTITTTQADPSIGFQLVTSGDEIEVDMGGIETAAFASSMIDTTTGAKARNADVITADFPPEMDKNFAVKFLWTPGTDVLNADRYFFEIRTVDMWGYLQFRYLASGEVSLIRHNNDITPSQSSASKTLAVTPWSTYDIRIRHHEDVGLDVWVDLVKGEQTASGDAAKSSLGGNIPMWYLGRSSNSSLLIEGCLADLQVHKGKFSDVQMVAL